MIQFLPGIIFIIFMEHRWQIGSKYKPWLTKESSRLHNGSSLYQDINGEKACYSKTNKILCLLADGLGARPKDQKLTDKKLSPGN